MAHRGLSPEGLTEKELIHFSEHGWLVLHEVLDAGACDRYIAAIDRCFGALRHATHPGLRTVGQPHLFDPFLLEWFKIPGVLEANRQLIGDPHIRLSSSSGHITVPHPERASRREELTDPSRLGWHRDFGPRLGTMPHDRDPRLVRSPLITNVTFLTPISPEDGSTAFLDGSHRVDGELEGGYEPLHERCPPTQATAGAGSIVLFSEALLHAAVPIVSERTRYALLWWLGASWVASDARSVPPLYADQLADDELRDLFQPARAGAA